MGIYKLNTDAGRVLALALHRATAEDAAADYEPVIGEVAKQVPVGYVPVGDLPWIEIDFPSDVDRAHNGIWDSIVRYELRK